MFIRSVRTVRERFEIITDSSHSRGHGLQKQGISHRHHAVNDVDLSWATLQQFINVKFKINVLISFV